MISRKRYLLPLLCSLFFPTFSQAEERIHIYVGAPVDREFQSHFPNQPQICLLHKSSMQLSNTTSNSVDGWI